MCTTLTTGVILHIFWILHTARLPWTAHAFNTLIPCVKRRVWHARLSYTPEEYRGEVFEESAERKGLKEALKMVIVDDLHGSKAFGTVFNVDRKEWARGGIVASHGLADTRTATGRCVTPFVNLLISTFYNTELLDSEYNVRFLHIHTQGILDDMIYSYFLSSDRWFVFHIFVWQR